MSLMFGCLPSFSLWLPKKKHIPIHTNLPAGDVRSSPKTQVKKNKIQAQPLPPVPELYPTIPLYTVTKIDRSRCFLKVIHLSKDNETLVLEVNQAKDNRSIYKNSGTGLYTSLSLIGFGAEAKARKVRIRHNDQDKVLLIFSTSNENKKMTLTHIESKQVRELRPTTLQSRLLPLRCSPEFVVQPELHFIEVKGDKDNAYTRDCLMYDYLPFSLETFAPYSETHRLQTIRHLLLGLQNIQEKGIVHRDIKKKNFQFYYGSKPRFNDFGYAEDFKDYPEKTLSNVCGTCWYLPPEYRTANPSPNFNFSALKKADIWSLGMVIYGLLTASEEAPGGKTMHLTPASNDHSERPYKVYKNQQRAEKTDLAYINYHIESLGPLEKTLLLGLLHPNPDLRFSINDAMSLVDQMLLNLKDGVI